jgi:PTS system mannitol-specific IIA component
MADQQAPELSSLLAESSIRLDETATSRDEAIRAAGQALIDAGAIDESYVDAMFERENSVSTYVGEGVAIPHGTLAGKGSVKKDALVVLRFPTPVDWDGNEVSVAVGIAAAGNGHIAILSQLASILMDPDAAAALRGATTTSEVYELLASTDDDE